MRRSSARLFFLQRRVSLVCVALATVGAVFPWVASGEEPSRDASGNLLIALASGSEVHCEEGSVSWQGAELKSCKLTESYATCESGHELELNEKGYLKACTLGRFGANINGSLPCGAGRIVWHENNNLKSCNLRESFHFYDVESKLHNCAAGTDVVFNDNWELLSCRDIPVNP
jgi:hypothetical protein